MGSLSLALEGDMQTLTGQYFEAQRRAQHLTLAQMATAIGYTNSSKGARRVQALEREGRTVPGLLDKVVQVLRLDREYVQGLIAEDRRRFRAAWEKWASERVEPVLRFRPFATLWCGEPLPKGLSRTDAIEYMRARAIGRHCVYVLIWSRSEAIYSNELGTTWEDVAKVGEVAGPYVTLRGRHGQGFFFG